jgi:hypothetical protein
MHAAIRSPLAAGVALVGAGAIAVTPIAAPPPDIHISDLRLTLSRQIMQANPVVAGERLVGQTASDTLSQVARVATFPIANALVLNVSRALGGGGAVRAASAVSAATTPAAVGTTAAAVAPQGGGVSGLIQNVVQDGVDTTVRLVPASIDAGLGVAASTVNAVTQTGLATVQAVVNVGAAALTLNPGAVVNAAALGAIRVAGTVEQTTIGAPALAFNSPQPQAAVAAPTLRTRTPSIVTSILNGRQEIADAISPPVARRQAVSSAAQNSAALTTAAAVGQNDTPVAKTTAESTSTVSSAAKATTGPKQAEK